MACKADLEKKIADARATLQRQRDEAAARARKEAEERAKVERERLEKEQAERIAKAQAERAAAEAKAAEEARLFGADAEPAVLPEVPKAEEIRVVPVVDTALIPEELGKSAVRQTVKKVLRIADAAKIPRQVAGVDCLVPDGKAIEKLLREKKP